MALSQVAQILLACSGGHGAELVRLVGGVLRIDDLGQQEVPEHRGLGKGHAFWDEGAKRGHVFGTSDRHTTKRGAQQGNECREELMFEVAID